MLDIENPDEVKTMLVTQFSFLDALPALTLEPERSKEPYLRAHCSGLKLCNGRSRLNKRAVGQVEMADLSCGSTSAIAIPFAHVFLLAVERHKYGARLSTKHSHYMFDPICWQTRRIYLLKLQTLGHLQLLETRLDARLKN